MGIGWVNDSMAMINFKKCVMTFENRDIIVIAPMNPNEGKMYVELVKEEVVGVRDHVYNISKEYIQPNVHDELGWWSSSSVSSDSDDALEKWNNQMHEVSIWKCGMINQSLQWVSIESVEFPTYEGLLDLPKFLVDFEDRVSEPQRLLALDEVLKATPT